MTTTFHSDLRAMARALNGEVVGGQVVCPGPGHSQRDRSLSVRLSAAAPLGYIAHSHSGDDWIVCRDYVARLLGFRPDDWKRGRHEAKPKPAPAAPDDRAAKIREALAYWNESVDPRRTIVEKYLNSRELKLPYDAESVIRWNARIGAMVSLMRNVRTGEPQAVLRTYLDRDGRKRTVFGRDGKELGVRLFKGPTGGAAIMIDPFDVVSGGLHIGEGVETCLAARQVGLVPAWALGSAGEIAKFPVLSQVETLTLLRERCDVNARAAEACGRRWVKAGREVFNIWPTAGKDFNDTIRDCAA